MEIRHFYKTKQEVATHQLNAAIRLFLEHEDIICSTTLAGAAEEILGKILTNNGVQPSIKEYSELCLDLLKIAGCTTADEKQIINERNKI